jgi:hypothetical protein
MIQHLSDREVAAGQHGSSVGAGILLRAPFGMACASARRRESEGRAALSGSFD